MNVIDPVEVERLQRVEKAALTCLKSLHQRSTLYTMRESYLEELLLDAFDRKEPLWNMRPPPPRSVGERAADGEKVVAYAVDPGEGSVTMRLSPETMAIYGEEEIELQVRQTAQSLANFYGACRLVSPDDAALGDFAARSANA